LTRKKAAVLIFILLIFAGIIALTQETNEELPLVEAENEFDANEELFLHPEEEKPLPEWHKKSARWFRSNAGGMAVEEIPSRLAALRNEYALVIDYAHKDDLPENLQPFYDDQFFIEIRVLFKKGVQSRTQWIFRDEDGRSRLVAVFMEKEAASEKQPEPNKTEDADEIQELLAVITENEITDELLTDLNEAVDADVVSEIVAVLTENEIIDETQADVFDSVINDVINEIVETVEVKKNNMSGFIEIYDENSFLTAEYRFFQDGSRNRTDFVFKDGLLLSSTFSLWEEKNMEQYAQVYTDYYRYNRSLYLRSMQRVFYKDRVISSNDPVVITFPSGILAAARETAFISERQNSYPDFFGEITMKKDSKVSYSTDEKGRILSQTFYDEEDNVIWAIYNTWSDDRIASTVKEEGDNVYLAEYEYDSSGDRVLERNYTNGVLQRVVRSEGKTDYEELYLNGKIILQAVWEDGRKISETMMR